MDSAHAHPPDISKLHILVLDDDSFQIALIREMLMDLGVRPGFIRTAHSGGAALQQVKAGKFDLLICDLHMPGMDGFQFMESLAALGFEKALLIVSGQSEQVCYSAGLIAQLCRLNYLGALVKPAAPAALRKVLVQLASDLPRAARAATQAPAGRSSG